MLPIENEYFNIRSENDQERSSRSGLDVRRNGFGYPLDVEGHRWPGVGNGWERATSSWRELESFVERIPSRTVLRLFESSPSSDHATTLAARIRYQLTGSALPSSYPAAD